MQGSTAPIKGSLPENTFDAMFIGTSQKINTSGTSQQSSAVGSTCSLVRIKASEDCYIAIGADPTASATTCHVWSGIVEYFAIKAGDKVAVIQDTDAGILYITEGATR